MMIMSKMIYKLLSKSKRQKVIRKNSVLKNVDILLKGIEYVLNSFKSNLFPILSDTTIFHE